MKTKITAITMATAFMLTLSTSSSYAWWDSWDDFSCEMTQAFTFGHVVCDGR